MMTHETIALRTADGTCPMHVFEPAARGQHPAVIFFMDGIGIRPALFEMGARLADGGYHVVMPDLYYRSGFKGGLQLFGDAAMLDNWRTNVLPTVTIAKIMSDMPAIFSYLDSSTSVASGKIGITGYCLGGRLSFAAAGHFPDRIAAAASYHPSGLATDAADSPHLLAPRMKSRVYVGGAIEDSGFDDAQKQRLENALTAAEVDHVVETYNARHGWVPSDTPVHDPKAAEKHWDTLFDLLAVL